MACHWAGKLPIFFQRMAFVLNKFPQEEGKQKKKFPKKKISSKLMEIFAS